MTTDTVPNATTAKDGDRLRCTSLTIDACAEITNLSKAIRVLIGQAYDSPSGMAAKALAARIEALSEAVSCGCADTEMTLEDVAKIVNATSEEIGNE